MRKLRVVAAVGVLGLVVCPVVGEELTPAVQSLSCVPVAAYWSGPPQSPGMPQGPSLAVVSTKIRPKDAQVHLNGRFIGRARYFDGTPGYLYLEPGKYQLELRLGGYRSELFVIDAQASCRFDIRHRMFRGQDDPEDRSSLISGKGRPLERVFSAQVSDKGLEEISASGAAGGADPNLRNDLRKGTHDLQQFSPPSGASLRLLVFPDSAEVFIDGSLVATAAELALMEAPLAISAGTHEIKVSASGFTKHSQTVVIEQGQILDMDISLVRAN